MKKVIILLLMSCFALGSFVSCSDDDGDFVSVANADKMSGNLFKMEIDHDQTVVDLDVESNTNWVMTKENENQVFWSFKNDFSDNDAHVKGDGNKSAKVYFIENVNESNRTAIISIHKGISKKIRIEITQKGSN